MVSKKINLFKLKILFTFIVIFFVSLSSVEANDTTCAKDADGYIKFKEGSATPFALASSPTVFNQDSCGQEPDEYKIIFKSVAICSKDPHKGSNLPDYSSCVDILSNEKTVTLLSGQDTNLLDGDLVLPVGEFRYLKVHVSNKIQVKHKQKYVNESNGADVILIGQGGTIGTWCYSKSVVTTYSNNYAGDASFQSAHGVTVVDSGASDADARLECGDEPTASEVEFATEIIDTMGDDAFEAGLDYMNGEESVGERAKGLYLAATALQEDGSVATTEDNFKIIGAHFRFDDPVIITPATTEFKLKLSTFGSVSIDMEADGTDIYGAKMGCDPFIVGIVNN